MSRHLWWRAVLGRIWLKRRRRIDGVTILAFTLLLVLPAMGLGW